MPKQKRNLKLHRESKAIAEAKTKTDAEPETELGPWGELQPAISGSEGAGTRGGKEKEQASDRNIQTANHALRSVQAIIAVNVNALRRATPLFLSIQMRSEAPRPLFV